MGAACHSRCLAHHRSRVDELVGMMKGLCRQSRHGSAAALAGAQRAPCSRLAQAEYMEGAVQMVKAQHSHSQGSAQHHQQVGVA